MKRNIFLVAVCAILLALTPGELSAQSIKIDKKYGNVSKAELEMTVYPLDTSAVALYLYKEVNYSVEIDPGGFAFIKKERERVKILKEAGKEYGDYEEFYSTESTAGEYISGIKVTTYNPGGLYRCRQTGGFFRPEREGRLRHRDGIHLPHPPVEH